MKDLLTVSQKNRILLYCFSLDYPKKRGWSRESAEKGVHLSRRSNHGRFQIGASVYVPRCPGAHRIGIGAMMASRLSDGGKRIVNTRQLQRGPISCALLLYSVMMPR
jgi:hypothetical protein